MAARLARLRRAGAKGCHARSKRRAICLARTFADEADKAFARVQSHRKAQPFHTKTRKAFQNSVSTARNRHIARTCKRSHVQSLARFGDLSKTRKGRGSHLTDETYLEAGFSEQNRISVIASQHGIDPKTVKRSRSCIAGTILANNCASLQQLEEMTTQAAPLAVFEGTAWDEAKPKVGFKLGIPGFSEQVACDAIEVMLAQRFLLCIWNSHAAQLNINIPPAAVTDTSA